jgi:hypothetical protein
MGNVGLIVDELHSTLADMCTAETYGELRTYFKKFVKFMAKLPSETPKCPQWKEAYKGAGAYYTLQNMVLFHNVVLLGCVNKRHSKALLEKCLESYRGEYWRFHAMLKKTIEDNNFVLAESIARNSK